MKILLDFMNLQETMDGLLSFLNSTRDFMLAPGVGADSLWIVAESKRLTQCIRLLGFDDSTNWDKSATFSMAAKADSDVRLRADFYPEDEQFTTLWGRIREIKAEYQRFIQTCRSGTPDIQFLNDLLIDAMYQGEVFVNSDDPFLPSLTLTRPRPEELEGYLALDVVKDFMEGRGADYKRIVECLNCGRYVAGRSTKIRYCSSQCKSAHHYQRRK